MNIFTENDNSLIETIRSFQKSCIFNRKCANCNEIGPNYICLDFGTFVCSTCSGIHREFNHKVKSISLSKWTLNEVKYICNNGNYRDARKYLSNIESSPYDSETYFSDYNKLKKFIKNKYIDHLWIDKNANSIDNLNNNKKNNINNDIQINEFNTYDNDIGKHNLQLDNRKYNKKNNYVDRNPFSILL
ncbi:hypothetical protein RS030_243640 [Cryptosporidium xiaoi]|uniref:Arf-GAP domain-containing protein n=1 Tax=Cryptosporidium xiaoi TaxID=659607 RepID=A0AAV9XWU4_9CRYT